MPNTDVVRVFTREHGHVVADNTLNVGTDAEVVVEVEASQPDYDLGAHYKTGLTIKDLDNGTDVVFAPAPHSGAIQTAPWTHQAETFTYAIAAADLAPHAGHVCQAHAYLQVGVTPATLQVSFAQSPMFLVS